MSKRILKEKGRVIAEHETTLDFPIEYVLTYNKANGFRVYIYHERRLLGADSARDANSDVWFATWTPEKGLMRLSDEPYVTLRKAGLLPVMEEFCKEAHEAWLDGGGPDV